MAKQKEKKDERPVLGIAWYREGDWDLLRKVSTDADELEETYAEWVSFASAQYAKFRSAGVRVAKVDIDIHELIAWCRDRHRPVDADSRSEFTAHKTAELYPSG